MEIQRIIFIITSMSMSIVNGTHVKQPIISLQNGGYGNLIVAINDTGESPDEVDQIVTGLAVLLEEGSKELFSATRETFYLHDVTILLPTHWQPTVRESSAFSTDQAHIRIGFSMSNHSYAYVRKMWGCGERSPEAKMHLAMYLLKDIVFLKDSSQHKKRKRLFSKTLVHELGHMLFGIYDEYKGVKNGTKVRAQCPAKKNKKVRRKRNCKASNLWNNFCTEIADANESPYASLMDLQWLDKVTEFCDNNPANLNTLHDPEAKSFQNRYCDGKSSWQVIRAHKDYKDAQNSKVVYQPVSFKIERRSPNRAVLLFDKSGSMTGCKMALEKMIVKQNFDFFVKSVEYLGVIWFSDFSYFKTPYMWNTKSLSYDQLEKLIPTDADGDTSLGIGIFAAINLLLRQTFVKGGKIFVITDCLENTRPYVDQYISKIKEMGVIVSFHMTLTGYVSDKNSNCYKMAQASGGYVVDHPLCQLTPEMNRLHRKALSAYTAPSDLWMHNHVTDIRDHTHVVKYFMQDTTFEGSVFIEDGLGSDTVFEFRPILWKNSDLKWIIAAPTGQVFTESSDCNYAGKIFDTHLCKIEDQNFHSGIWKYQVWSKNPIGVVTLVQSKWSKKGNFPVMMTASWQRDTLTISDSEPNKEQLVIVEFHRGEPLMNPVLNAEVIAEVTTPGGRLITINLNDEGQDGDFFFDDGIYSALFFDFDMEGTYNVLVYGRGTNETVAVKRTCDYGIGWHEVGSRELTGPFTRVNWGGQFQLYLNTSKGYFYSPGKITEILILGTSEKNRTVTLSWVAVGSQLYNGTASFYDIRIGYSINSIRENRVQEQIKVIQDMIVKGVNLSSPRSAGETEIATIKLPLNVTSGYINIIVATRYNNKTAFSKQGAVEYFSLLTSGPPPSSHGKPVMIISLIVIGFLILAIILIGSVVWIVKWKKKPEHHEIPLDQTSFG